MLYFQYVFCPFVAFLFARSFPAFELCLLEDAVQIVVGANSKNVEFLVLLFFAAPAAADLNQDLSFLLPPEALKPAAARELRQEVACAALAALISYWSVRFQVLGFRV